MTYKLLPVEGTSLILPSSLFFETDPSTNVLYRLVVDFDSLTDPTSSIITPDVIKAYSRAGGDFAEAVPFCLLRAKATFLRDANRNREFYVVSLFPERTVS